MNIPNLPTSPMVTEDGNPTDIELIYRQNLNSALQQGIGNEGVRIPGQSTANIAVILAATDPTDNPCALIWDTDLEQLKAIVNIAGTATLKTVTLT